jgi:NTE family protein
MTTVSQGRPAATEKQVLVLQGGGALGAYQAGAYQALQENGYEPDWIAGISIGAINGAIIAGNRADKRVEMLRDFWNGVSATLLAGNPCLLDGARSAMNEFSAGFALMFGIPGFFTPRLPPSVLSMSSDPGSVGYYDTGPLRSTLNGLVDFSYLNSQSAPRLSVGAVEIKSGNFEYFDNKSTRFEATHIMASGALPPGFPPVEVNGKYYWDGGLVSNTPLDYIMEYTGSHDDMCIFQVDVFNARGELPRNILEIAEREKDIRYSSRTRFNSDHVKVLHELRHASRNLLAKLPTDMRQSEEAKTLHVLSNEADITIAQIIRRDARYETGNKDFEFSRQSVEEHWKQGQLDVERGIRSKKWKERGTSATGLQVFDLTHKTMQL